MMEEKGRRFGKFNIVDIIIILILIVGVIFLAVKFLGSRGGEENDASVRIEYTVLVRKVDPQVCENVMAYKNANVQLMANGQMVDGNVVDITYGPHINYEADSNGVVTSSEEQGEDARVDMYFTIQATANNTINYKVGTQEVRIGKVHIVKTTEFEMEDYETVTISRKVLQ